jgi:ribosomal protein S18 acetylase RimI-like enzyme
MSEEIGNLASGQEKLSIFGLEALTRDGDEKTGSKRLREIVKEFFPEYESGFVVGYKDIRVDLTTVPEKDAVRGRCVLEWNMKEMAGCCGIFISYGASVYPSFQRKGLGKKALDCRLKIAREMDYSQFVCTVRDDNKIEQHMLEKAGLKQIPEMSFVNKRTKNKVLWYSINI